MSYDAWKTRPPEDEPGYWDNQPPEEDEPDEWIFTFGFSHTHPETGESLANCYVVIPDLTLDEARELMTERFGLKWAFQYPSRKAAGVEKYNLREVVIP